MRDLLQQRAVNANGTDNKGEGATFYVKDIAKLSEEKSVSVGYSTPH